MCTVLKMATLAPLLLNMMYLAGASDTCPIQIVPRDDWNARPPVHVEPIEAPLSHVIIHHSYIPGPCGGPYLPPCDEAMRAMQDYHQIEKGWNDIGYSFGVGGDGKVYNGRGWQVVGAHAPGYNDKSVGICLIGDWRTDLPSEAMLKAVKDLIACGVVEGRLRKDYILLGHRQVRDTECPGDRLYNEISTWPHYSTDPNTNPSENNETPP